MKDVFTLIRNEYKSPIVKEARDRLVLIVATHRTTIIEPMFDGITEDGDIPEESSGANSELGVNKDIMMFDLESHKDTSSYRWVMSAYNSVQFADENSPENAHHSIRFEKYLIHTFVRSPLWSNLMLHEFESDYDYATSTPVENEFKTIKTLLNFKNQSGRIREKAFGIFDWPNENNKGDSRSNRWIRENFCSQKK